MADYQLIARNGVRLTEDGVEEEVIVEAGPHTVISANAAIVLDDDDIGKLVSNKGALAAVADRIVTLFAPGASGGRFAIFADLGPGMRILAPAGKQIRLGDLQCVAGGYIESKFAQVFRIWSLDSDEFMVEGNPENFDVQTS